VSRTQNIQNLNSDRHPNNGMTLVEVLVAIFVLSLTIGVGVGALMANRRTAESVSRQTQTIHAARATLERLTSRTFYHADLSIGTHTISTGGSYTVSRIPPTDPLSKLKLVVVSIPWIGGDPTRTNLVPTETLTTVISEALHP